MSVTSFMLFHLLNCVSAISSKQEKKKYKSLMAGKKMKIQKKKKCAEFYWFFNNFFFCFRAAAQVKRQIKKEKKNLFFLPILFIMTYLGSLFKLKIPVTNDPRLLPSWRKRLLLFLVCFIAIIPGFCSTIYVKRENVCVISVVDLFFYSSSCLHWKRSLSNWTVLVSWSPLVTQSTCYLWELL
jgi:hypothetical protein